ncbi:MAG: transferase [Syntrophobacteraceae bacterium]
MTQIQRLIDQVIDRVNVNLREPPFDAGPYVRNLIPLNQFSRFYAFYGLTSYHPIRFKFHKSSLAGSYFLGKCSVDHSILYKSDIRGDELKVQGQTFKCCNLQIPIHEDEEIRIKDSFLIKSLVHSNSHDLENPEEFMIRNTIAMHYANIHGAPTRGCFIGPFGTIDLTTFHNCLVGTYSYVQTGELNHHRIPDGQIWIRSTDAFNFLYRFPPEVLKRYIHVEPGSMPTGLFMEFMENRERDFEAAFYTLHTIPPIPVPLGATLNRYAVVRGKTVLSENVLVAQRAYLEDAWLGKGSNVQENCYIIRSRLDGYNVTAHGGKVMDAHIHPNTFVGFNAFLHGTPEFPLTVGSDCIVMPHTIVDLEEPVTVPPGHLVWGCIRNGKDLETHSIALDELSKRSGEVRVGDMVFQGSGAMFVSAFRHRVEHILESNGAMYDGENNRGHAQKGSRISFNIIQPYPEGDLLGLYPSMEIRP